MLFASTQKAFFFHNTCIIKLKNVTLWGEIILTDNYTPHK